MRKKMLSLALALVVCLGLVVPASAAGTEKVVEDETHGVKITFSGFLREETHYYNCMVQYDEDTGELMGGATREHTIYVVADNSTVTVEALPGRKYADPKFVEGLKDHGRFGGGFTHDPQAYEIYKTTFGNDMESYAYMSTYNYDWDPENKCFHDFGGPAWPLEKAQTLTVSPSEGYIGYSEDYKVSWMCESDYAKLVPATLKTSDWAAAEVTRAYDAHLMAFSPYLVNCTRSMNRGEFAATMVRLYDAMTNETDWSADVDTDHPFTDVDWDTTPYDWDIGLAYNLGIVKGEGGGLFKPNGTLTRQEAAVMLSRVYTKVHGDIPKVANTSFADDSDVASWAKSEVAFMVGKEIANGVGENRFAPTRTLTVQEAVIMANRMLEKLK